MTSKRLCRRFKAEEILLLPSFTLLTSLFSFLFCNITILFLSNKAEKEDYGIRLIFSRGCWRGFSTFFVGAGCDRGMVILVMYLIAVAVLCGYQIGEPNIIERELYLNRGD